VFPLKDNIPTERFPVVTVALIVANALMYLFFQKALGGGVWDPSGEQAFRCNVKEFGAVPREFADSAYELDACGGENVSRWITPFTSMFMHGSLLHLGGNMLFLWIFGNNVEDAMGRVKFVIFYLLGGLAAIVAQTVTDTDVTIPTVGASGAVAAILGAYLLLHPRARVVTVIFLVVFFTIIEIPAMAFLLIWLVQQLFFASLEFAQPTADGQGGGVAYFAHIGGFVFGLALIKVFARRKREERPLFG
jgi:membrane associated rhomboid family serine protease